MRYVFYAYGHQNITAAHKTTLEFTKDKEVSLKGDCILGVKADFDLDKLRRFIKKSKSRRITIRIATPDGRFWETVNAELNPGFSSNREIVARKTSFASERTLAINADKAACDVNRKLAGFLKGENAEISVIIEEEEK